MRVAPSAEVPPVEAVGVDRSEKNHETILPGDLAGLNVVGEIGQLGHWGERVAVLFVAGWAKTPSLCNHVPFEAFQSSKLPSGPAADSTEPPSTTTQDSLANLK